MRSYNPPGMFTGKDRHAQTCRGITQPSQSPPRTVSDSKSPPAKPLARKKKTADGTQSIQRAAAVMCEIATRWPKGRKLSDIAEALNLEQGTVQRIVKGLLFHGMVWRVPGTRNYRLGHVAYELGLAAASSYPLRELCQPSLMQLVRETGDPVFLVVRSGMDAVCVDHLHGTFPIQAHALDIGSRRPLGVTAGSIALLVDLPSDEIERIIQANSRRETVHGSLTADMLRERVAISQRLGYALNDEGALPGVSAVGLPLRLAGDGPPFAAVSVASIASRVAGERRDMLVRALTRTTRELEALIAERKLDWR